MYFGSFRIGLQILRTSNELDVIFRTRNLVEKVSVFVYVVLAYVCLRKLPTTTHPLWEIPTHPSLSKPGYDHVIYAPNSLISTDWIIVSVVPLHRRV